MVLLLFFVLAERRKGEGRRRVRADRQESPRSSFSLPRCCVPVFAFFAGQLPPTRRDGIASASGVRTKANVLAATLRPRMISKG